jgi:hypothetical protein
MRYQSILPLFLFSSVFAHNAALKPCQPLSCRPAFIDIRHTERRGIGYQNGYTTLELFAIPTQTVSGFYPYCDVRGHLFDDGRGAFNAGIGARFLENRIWGFNAYYDFRKTKKKLFNQFSAGLESIGQRWDFYANGYLVVGAKKGTGYDFAFSHFQNNSAFLKERVDYAMSGLDGKVRYHFIKKQGWDLFFDIGPYAYFKKNNAIGCQAKLAAKIADYLFLEANTSYDHLFKWIGQGVVGFNIPLGPKDHSTTAANCSSGDTLIMRDRLTQIPAKQEIIVVNRRKHTFPAINPATGQLYQFLFVNNLFGSSGTYQDPYGDLADAEAASAPGDIIFVFPGDETSRNMNAGIILQNNQQLLGAGTDQILSTQKGDITIPAQASTMPLITNNTGVAVTLANSNTVSGIHIFNTDNAQHGIKGMGVSDATISNNWIECVFNTTKYWGVYLSGPGLSGTSTISNNIISASGSKAEGAVGIDSETDSSYSTVCQVNVLNNTLTGTGYGVRCGPLYPASQSHPTIITLEISGNNIEVSPGNKGIAIDPHRSNRIYYTIAGNMSSGGSYGLYMIARNTAYLQGTASHNTFFNNVNPGHTTYGFYFSSGGEGTTMILSADGNQFYDNANYDFYSNIPGDSSGYECLRLTNNIALTHGYYLNNEVLNPGSVINIASFMENTGPLTKDGEGQYTYNPTCP